jgi:hypothetical protein
MTDKEILLKAIEIIGEFSEVRNDEVVSSYEDLITNIRQFMAEVGFDEE